MPKSKKNKNLRNKRQFIVKENESIQDCLARMKEAGYQPVRRREKPIFKESDTGVEPVEREIVFDVIPAKDER